MNIFDLMRQSRNAALYRILYQQRMNAQCVGGIGEDSPTPPSPDPDPVPDVVVETQDALKEAFEEVEDGGLIQLAASIDVSGEPLIIPEGKTVTVDLNGMTVESDGLTGTNTKDSIFAVRRGGTLILEDTSTDSSGKVDGSKVGSIYAAVKLTEKGEDDDGKPAKVIINSGTYVGTYYAVTGNGARRNTDVTVNGGKFSSTASDSIGFYQPQYGKLVINGGEFEGPTALYIKSGNITINGGTFKGTGPTTPFKHNKNGADPTGDAVVIESCDYPGQYPVVEVNGGTFLSENGNGIQTYAQTGHEYAILTRFIKGGTFSNEVPEEMIADGYVQEQVDGKYVVKKV